MSREASTPARALLADARRLAELPADDTAGLWPRAAVILARQSLEVALKTYWAAKGPGVEDAPMRAQLLCLVSWLGDERVAREAHYAWSALSSASHYHPSDLAPTQDEIMRWCDTVQEVIAATERAWRR